MHGWFTTEIKCYYERAGKICWVIFSHARIIKYNRQWCNRTKRMSRHAYDDDATGDFNHLVDNHVRGVQNNDGVKNDSQMSKWRSWWSLTGTLNDWSYFILHIYSYPLFAIKKAKLNGLFEQYSSLKDIHDVIHDYGEGSFSHMAASAIGA